MDSGSFRGRKRKWRRSKYYANKYSKSAKYTKYSNYNSAEDAPRPSYLKIAEITGVKPRYVHVRGKVIYSSGVRPWENADKGDGKKFCFDIADNTGTIRVSAWGDVAVYAGERIKRNKTVEIQNVAVGPRKPQFNNLDHPFELTMFEKSVIVDLNFPIAVVDEKIRYVSFEDVPRFPENYYFSVTGKIRGTVTLSSGFGQERGKPYTKQTFEIVDERDNALQVVAWNEEMPTSDLDGKTISLLRCKYSDRHKSIDVRDAYIILDGHQLK